MNQYVGECLCGTCRYTISGAMPKAMFLCHCSRCRKETGSVHCANVFFSDAQLSWDKGADNISQFHLEGTRKQRAFCKTCGSPLPLQDNHGHVMLPAGTLDAGAQLEPTAHVFYASRTPWEDKLANLHRFDDMPK